MAIDFSDIESLRAHLGDDLGPSRWFTIDQTRIDAFGEVTEDHEAMHMDPDWARQHSPFGDTIAFGFLTLSMLTAMVEDFLPRGNDEAHKLNYGFDRVRFMAPVKTGAQIRAQAKLVDVRARGKNSIIAALDVKVEIKGEAKPALMATWLFLVVNSIPDRR